MASYQLSFSQPWWLLACVGVIPLIWLARHSLVYLNPVRRYLTIILRVLVITVLILLLARPLLVEENKNLALITVIDRSQSIPATLQEQALAYLDEAMLTKKPTEQLAVVDVAEAASVSKLPSGDPEIRRRNTTLSGLQSKLADGVQMAMAIASPETATRILLVSDGNETDGDLKEAARIAAANHIPIDILPLRYQYENEVVFKRLAVPSQARSGQTISLRFILSSTTNTRGSIQLNLNSRPVDLDPDSARLAVPIELKPGTNVKTISLPVGTHGLHDFQAVYIPDDSEQDKVTQNNRAGGMTFVAGPGHVLVLDTNGQSGQAIVDALAKSDIDVRYGLTDLLPNDPAQLMSADAVVLVNTDCSQFTYQQQEMLCRYVTDMGGGLVMVGGSNAFGAGGWIGSPVADILPVDLDPPQKKQLPKGALVLIMHACEMPQGNLWGKRTAIAAIKTLSRMDIVGILAYDWEGKNDWVYPLSEVGDKNKIIHAINQMQMGDMPDLHYHLQLAYQQLKDVQAGQKHVIVITDGDPNPPSAELLDQCKAAGITCSTVGIFPHSRADLNNLIRVSQKTGGRFYDVKDPQQLPKIFIKEAQVVRRALIVEATFTPQITYSLSEITKGFSATLPDLDGYVLTGPKGGLSQTILSSQQADPILAICQSGLGRCVAFTSSADSRWASNWLAWGGMERFWEQTIRWVEKSASSSDYEVNTDVQGRNVTVHIERDPTKPASVQPSSMEAVVISPNIATKPLELTQVGPGQYQGFFEARDAGNYIVNLRYKKPGESRVTMSQTPVTVPFAPEFRDLSDNFGLLNQVCQITSGRLLGEDPTQENLFDTTGVKFPQTHMPLTRPLMLIWLVLFLLDVAVRRIALDVRAIWRKVLQWVRRPLASKKKQETIDRLQQTHRKLRDKLKKKSDSQTAARRYEYVDQQADDIADLKVASTAKKDEKVVPKTPEKKEDAKPSEQSHIQQLLNAKRQSRNRDQDH